MGPRGLTKATEVRATLCTVPERARVYHTFGGFSSVGELGNDNYMYMLGVLVLTGWPLSLQYTYVQLCTTM